MRNVIIAATLSFLLVGAAWATCPSCPNPPCEIAQCPPDEAPIFSNILINGVKKGIGQTGDLVESNGTITINSVENVEGNTFDLVFSAEGMSTTDGQDITITTDAYSYDEQTGTYSFVEVESVEIASSVYPNVGEDACLARNVACTGTCTSTPSCKKVTWCSDGQNYDNGTCIEVNSVCFANPYGNCNCLAEYADCGMLGGYPTIHEFRFRGKCLRAISYAHSICVVHIDDIPRWEAE